MIYARLTELHENYELDAARSATRVARFRFRFADFKILTQNQHY